MLRDKCGYNLENVQRDLIMEIFNTENRGLSVNQTSEMRIRITDRYILVNF